MDNKKSALFGISSFALNSGKLFYNSSHSKERFLILTFYHEYITKICHLEYHLHCPIGDAIWFWMCVSIYGWDFNFNVLACDWFCEYVCISIVFMTNNRQTHLFRKKDMKWNERKKKKNKKFNTCILHRYSIKWNNCFFFSLFRKW